MASSLGQAALRGIVGIARETHKHRWSVVMLSFIKQVKVNSTV